MHACIIEQRPPSEALAIHTVLESFEFNNQDLASERRALKKLQTLDDKSIERIKQAFIRYNHPSAHLIRICGFLMQTKIYLSWKRK